MAAWLSKQNGHYFGLASSLHYNICHLLAYMLRCHPSLNSFLYILKSCVKCQDLAKLTFRCAVMLVQVK